MSQTLISPPRNLGIDPTVRTAGPQPLIAGRREQKRSLKRFKELAASIVKEREADGTFDAYRRLHDKFGRVPLMAGGVDSPVHPLAAPTVSGSNITVDLMLNNPTRITRMIMDLTLQRFIADRVFGNGGSVTGGAVIYDEVAENELYAERDVQRIEPGAEVPIIETERRVPKVAPVEKWGGKVWTPYEARDRNNSVLFTNKMRQLGNTIVRKINQRAIGVLEAALAANPGQVSAGTDWSTVVVGGSSQSNADEFPAADFAHMHQFADEDELGIVYTLWLLNPQEYAQLVIIYGQGLSQLLASMNVSIYVSNRVAAGTAYVVAEGQVGQMRLEQPLATETWRENGRQRDWTQSTVRPLMFVDNVFAVRKLTGLAG